MNNENITTILYAIGCSAVGAGCCYLALKSKAKVEAHVERMLEERSTKRAAKKLQKMVDRFGTDDLDESVKERLRNLGVKF